MTRSSLYALGIQLRIEQNWTKQIYIYLPVTRWFRSGATVAHHFLVVQRLLQKDQRNSNIEPANIEKNLAAMYLVASRGMVSVALYFFAYFNVESVPEI